jgi:hypothetical protein
VVNFLFCQVICMVRISRGCTLILLAAMAVTTAFAGQAHRAEGHSARAHVKHRGRRAKAHVVRGQREIDAARATEIQKALIREHYLNGAPSGQWDGETEAAMQKYQADNGWQTKLTPDSRALIKLGLGPNGSAGASEMDAAETAPDRSPSAAMGEAEPGTLASVHAISN